MHTIFLLKNNTVMHCGELASGSAVHPVFQLPPNSNIQIAAGHSYTIAIVNTLNVELKEFPVWGIIIAVVVPVIALFGVVNAGLILCLFCCRLRPKHTLQVEMSYEELSEVSSSDGAPQIRLHTDMFEIPFDDLKDFDQIGTGGSGNLILKARWKQESVVVKLFAHRNKEFFTELEVLLTIKHSNIISFVGCMTKKPKLGVVLEYCRNGSLIDYVLARKGTISFATKLQWLLQIAKGVRFLHSKGIIHRDLKCKFE